MKFRQANSKKIGQIIAAEIESVLLLFKFGKIGWLYESNIQALRPLLNSGPESSLLSV